MHTTRYIGRNQTDPAFRPAALLPASNRAEGYIAVHLYASGRVRTIHAFSPEGLINGIDTAAGTIKVYTVRQYDARPGYLPEEIDGFIGYVYCGGAQ